MNQPLIKLDHVSKYYKTKTGVSEGMRGINLEFSLNEFVAITGESGSGKTTLLNVISGLDSYEDGELYINGLETSHYSVKDWENFRAKYVGFVFQNYNVIDSYTVYENVVIALEAQGYKKKEIKERALELIDRVGLTSHKNQRTAKLSGGQKQRVVIARALAKNAPIILADEPTGNLDEQSSQEILKLLKEISEDKLVILVTHNFNEAKDYVTRNIVMQDGNIKNDFTLKDVPKKSKEIISIDESNISSADKAIKIASRNIKSMPKRTIFNVLLSMIVVFAFVFFYSSLIKEAVENANSFSDQHFLFLNKKDNTNFNLNEITEIKNKGSKYTFVTFTTLDTIKRKYAGEINEFEFLLEDINFLSKTDIFEGRLPNSKDEIVIRKNYFHEIKINDTIEIFNQKFKVVGFTSFSIPSSNSFSSQNTIYLDNTFLYENGKLKEEVINYYQSKINNFNEEDILYNQIIVKARDRRELKNIKNKLINNYQVIDEASIFEKQFEFIRGTILLIMWAILLGILAIIFLVIYHVQKNMMENRKKDFAVYRSIGISEKEVGLIVLFEQLIIALIAVILTYIVLIVLSNTIDKIYLITRNVSIFDYMIIAVIFALFTLSQGLKYNKKVFNVTVIESLKEDF